MRHIRNLSQAPKMAQEETTGPSITQILSAIKTVFDAMIQIVTALSVFDLNKEEQ